MKGSKGFFCALCAAAALALAACAPSGGAEGSLSETQLSLNVGESAVLELTVDDIIILQGVAWSSDDESVAAVQGGTVTAVGEGSVQITAAYGGVTYVCAVEVVHVPAVGLSEEELFLGVGDTASLALLSDGAAQESGVAWSSSDESVARVEGGEVTYLSAGSATITAQYGGKAYPCALTVCEQPVGVYYCRVQVPEMEDVVFEFDLTLNGDKSYTYFRRDSGTPGTEDFIAGETVSESSWRFAAGDTLEFDIGGGTMRMKVEGDSLVSVGEIPTGGMDAALTFRKVGA